jgi:hypothetical protein
MVKAATNNTVQRYHRGGLERTLSAMRAPPAVQARSCLAATEDSRFQAVEQTKEKWNRKRKKGEIVFC